MQPATLNRYHKLYRSAKRMGADRVFNEFTGRPLDRQVPLSISHGVDFGHLDKPMNVEGAEPIHWAYNSQIHERSCQIKPTILAPHPWLMLESLRPPGPSVGSLVVAAPPGPENDSNLFAALQGIEGPFTILVKPRGAHQSSTHYWRERGIPAVTAGPEGPDFYTNLYSIISGATRVIGCNFSSALVFAAAIGKPVDIIKDYSHHTYIYPASKLNYELCSIKDVVRTFIHGNTTMVTDCARELLGASLEASSERVLETLDAEIQRAKSPVYFRGAKSPVAALVLREAALLTGKVGVLNNLRRGVLDYLFGREVYDARINEIALWETGDFVRYFDAKRVRYVKGKTEGGLAVDAYEN